MQVGGCTGHWPGDQSNQHAAAQQVAFERAGSHKGTHPAPPVANAQWRPPGTPPGGQAAQCPPAIGLSGKMAGPKPSGHNFASKGVRAQRWPPWRWEQLQHRGAKRRQTEGRSMNIPIASVSLARLGACGAPRVAVGRGMHCSTPRTPQPGNTEMANTRQPDSR